MKRKLKQTVLIGLGGTGSRAVNNVARMLRKEDIEINDGIVTCAVLDTNQSDNDLIKATGTDIPVIPTCDERTIKRYLQDHASKDPMTWCPYSRSFGAESMIDGASEIRVKSRLAFMDTMDSKRIFDLQNAMEKVFHNRPNTPEKVRVMLVSSLAGGTGAGMFLQVALWLRKFFASRNCMVSIRGIFLLPDIFIRTIENAKDDEKKKRYYYANAYACIRELNTLNKIIKGDYQPERPIVIPDLFDSRNPPEKPVFDFAFFIDDVDAKGASFKGIESYEKMVAQIVYMQLYAPMINEMVSVEDNLYRSFEKSTEPVYGSCGTAKAVYPVEDIMEYCALRAASDSVSEGWGRIDAEIKAMIKEQEDAERDGDYSSTISIRDTYLRLFDEKSKKTGKEVGRSDRFFVSIKNDIFNEKRKPSANGKPAVDLSCKVEDFLKLVSLEIEKSVTKNGGCDSILSIGEDLPDPSSPENFNENTKATLQGVREEEIQVVNNVLRAFDEKKQEYANSILRSIVPVDMGSVNKNDEKSLYGLFQKRDVNDQLHYVHPVAARYLIYKLSKKIEERQNKLYVDTLRQKAEEGDTELISFDNPDTRRKETMLEYWDQIGHFTSKKELQHFLKQYKLYNAENKNLCVQYETAALTQLVLNALKERVEALSKQMKTLFDDFEKLVQKLQKDMRNNVARNQNNLPKVLYVYAKKEHKDEIYESLSVDLAGKNESLYGDVIQTVYGKFCSEYRPSAEENKIYRDKSISVAFYEAIVDSYRKLLEDKKGNYRKKLNLDIISAICKESDYTYAHEAEDDDEEEKDIFAQESEAEKETTRHATAITEYRRSLAQKAVPFLQTEPESADIQIEEISNMLKDENNKMWMTTGSGKKIQISLQTSLTFWGFHEKVGEVYPEIGAELGANQTTAASKGYPINELYCYSSIYGVKASSIPKFKETSGGDYFENYSAVINGMIRDKSEVDTPHIDKTWHEFLPYVGDGMQEQYKQKFYKTLWLAIAYGRLELDKLGRYQISEKNTDSYGNALYDFSLMKENGRNIPLSEVSRLIAALRNYPDFESSIARDMQVEFEKDLEVMTTYVGTKLIQGLLVEGDLNPITMIVRYASAKDAVSSVAGDMLGGLRALLKELAAHYDLNRSDELIAIATVRLLHRFYEKCGLVSKRQYLRELVKEFKSLKLPVEGEDEEEAAVVEDII